MQSAGDKAEADLKSAGDDVKGTAKNLESGAKDKAAEFRSDAKDNASQAQSEAKGYVQSATDAVKVHSQYSDLKVMGSFHSFRDEGSPVLAYLFLKLKMCSRMPTSIRNVMIKRLTCCDLPGPRTFCNPTKSEGM